MVTMNVFHVWTCQLFILKLSREQLQLTACLIAAAGNSAGLSCGRCSAYVLHLMLISASVGPPFSHQLPDIM